MRKQSNNSSLIFGQSCRKIRINRDARFDGLFFSAASTTKIYCRPTCPAGPPLEQNNIFFQSRAVAEKSGYRPCLRCRPELAPDNGMKGSVDWLARQTISRVHRGLVPDITMPSIDLQTIVGTTLNEYQQTVQLGFAKILLTDTQITSEKISEIVQFKNSQKMMVALSELYRRDPLTFRKPIPVDSKKGLKSCALMLSYRPPFNWPILLDYYRHRAIPGVEVVTDDTYQRSFSIDGHKGWLSVQNRSKGHSVLLTVYATDLSCLMEVVWRIRRMFDLDGEPMAVDALLKRDPILGKVIKNNPGIRVPVAWDSFECAVRAVAGQLISITASTKLVERIVCKFASDLLLPAPTGIFKLFPHPVCLKEADLSSCGLTRTKATAIHNLAEAVSDHTLDLDNTTDLDAFIKQCTTLHGIGEWTAQTIALRGMGHEDAFPASDLGIVKAMSTGEPLMKPAHIIKEAERWRPLRAYAAKLLWLRPKEKEKL